MPKKMSREEFIQKAISVHGNKYDYAKVVYENSKTPVEIVCSRHGSFFQSPSAHLKGQQCPYCQDRKPLTLKEFEKRACKIHGDKYDYSRVTYVNNKTPVEIICPSHGSFMQTPHNHLKGRGCPRCAKNHKLSQDDFIRKANEVHNYFYDYSKTKYTKNSAKVTITCPIHGDFTQEANSHLMGIGCPVCGMESRIETMRTACYFKSEDYRNHLAEYKAREMDTKLKNGTFTTSALEELLYEKLIARFGETDVLRQYQSDAYPFACDFYIKSRDMYIELNASWTHGRHWFESINNNDVEKLEEWKQKNKEYYDIACDVWANRDCRKRQCAINNSLNYIVFWMPDSRDIDLWFALDCPSGNDAVQLYSWLPARLLHEDMSHYEITGVRSMSQIVKQYQFHVIYRDELRMWQQNNMYKDFPLQAFLYANRYYYLGKLPQQLTDKEILRGFKIAGIKKGYTVFDAFLMQMVIEKYRIQSVYDPCAGWGERMLMCFKHHIRYFGIDINNALLDGYQRLIQDYNMSHQSFAIADASIYIPSEIYNAVITCPPYHDIEIYSEQGAENLSYDDFLVWWDAVVKNTVKTGIRYFCFQINQKYKKDMVRIVMNHGFEMIEEIVSTNNKSSHFTRKKGVNRKAEYESMIVLRKSQ